jgi:ankyrin repeat protein
MKRPVILLFAIILATALVACNRNRQGSSPASQQITARPDVPLTDAETELLAAAFRGDNEAVRDLLAKGVNVNIKDVEGRTPLTEAAWNGHSETIKLLLEHGADPRLKKNDGETALSLATARGQKDAAAMLKKAVTK